jgi:hypothetical protein
MSDSLVSGLAGSNLGVVELMMTALRSTILLSDQGAPVTRRLTRRSSGGLFQGSIEAAAKVTPWRAPCPVSRSGQYVVDGFLLQAPE